MFRLVGLSVFVSKAVTPTPRSRQNLLFGGRGEGAGQVGGLKTTLIAVQI